MSKSRKISWAIVGIGSIALKRVAPAILAQPDSSLYACVTRDRTARTDDLATLKPEKVYSDFDQMIRDPLVDAVYLATPTFLHAPHAIQALRSGKAVIVEKPMAMSAQEATTLCEVAEEVRGRLSVAYYRRFWPRFQLVADMLSRAELGRIVLVRIAMHSWYHPEAGAAGSWRVQPEQSGGGVLSDVGCHRLDLLCWWLGMPKTLVGSTANRVQPYPAEDEASALITLENGAQVTASFNWNSKTWSDEIHIVGTESRITLSPCDGDEVQITRGRETEVRAVEKPSNGHFPMIDDFARSIIEDRMPRFTGRDGLTATKVMDAIYASSRQQAWQEIA